MISKIKYYLLLQCLRIIKRWLITIDRESLIYTDRRDNITIDVSLTNVSEYGSAGDSDIDLHEIQRDEYTPLN